MSNTPQPPIDPSVSPINNNSGTSILNRPQYTSWMKSQSVNRQEEPQEQTKQIMNKAFFRYCPATCKMMVAYLFLKIRDCMLH